MRMLTIILVTIARGRLPHATGYSCRFSGEFGPADRLMGVPVLYADNDNAVRREVMEHFFLDFL